MKSTVVAALVLCGHQSKQRLAGRWRHPTNKQQGDQHGCQDVLYNSLFTNAKTVLLGNTKFDVSDVHGWMGSEP